MEHISSWSNLMTLIYWVKNKYYHEKHRTSVRG